MAVLTRRAGWLGRFWVPAVLLFALLVRGLGCGESTSPPEVAAVRIDPTEASDLLPGETHQLRAIATDVHGSRLAGVRFVWKSADTSVATVDGVGTVLAHNVGFIEISASVNSVTGRALVAVVTPVARLTVDPQTLMVLPGKTIQLGVRGEDAAGQPIQTRAISWTSSDESIATISTTGLLTGLRPGNATATATVTRKSATAPIFVLAPVAALHVAPSTVTLHPQDTLQLTATITDALGHPLEGRSVAWSVSNGDIATVSPSGLLRALRNGQGFVIADADGQRDSAGLVVRAPVGSVVLNPNRRTLLPGGTVDLEVTVRDAQGRTLSGREVAWTSSATEVAGVSEAGRVTAIRAGSATITATSEGGHGGSEITVLKPVATVSVAPSSRKLTVGEMFQFEATLRSSDGEKLTDRHITWSSERSSVVRVSSDGRATAVSRGTTKIEAASEGVEGNATVEVSRPEDEPVVLVGAGDIASCDQDGDERTARLLDDIPGTVFVAGDNVYPDGSLAVYQNCYDPSWGRHKVRTRPVPGNHEYETPAAQGYFDYFGEVAGDRSTGYYSYDLGAWHVLALNTQFTGKEGSPQADWVRHDLEAHPRPCILAIWHVPVFGPDSASVRMQYVYKLLYDAGAELIVNGHEHSYQRWAPQTDVGVADPERGIREFIVGTGGAGVGGRDAAIPNREAFYAAGPGVLKLTLYAGSYDWKFIPVDGAFTDSGSASCH